MDENATDQLLEAITRTRVILTISRAVGEDIRDVTGEELLHEPAWIASLARSASQIVSDACEQSGTDLEEAIRSLLLLGENGLLAVGSFLWPELADETRQRREHVATVG